MELITRFAGIGSFLNIKVDEIEVDIFKKDEINIENFGFSYCLTKTKDKVLLSESSLAMGGYFQEGVYEEPAYKKALLHKPISKGLFHNIILK